MTNINEMTREQFVARFMKEPMDEQLFAMLEEVQEGKMTAREVVLRLFYAIDTGELPIGKTLSELEGMLDDSRGTGRTE